MPNHVKNKLTILGNSDEVAKVLSFLKGDKEDVYIDFNNIVPMPETLNVEDNSTVKHVYNLLFGTGFCGNIKDEIKNIPLKDTIGLVVDAYQYKTNFEKYGAMTWYDWCSVNWGTKWNAYEQSFESQNTIIFHTAWSPVVGLIQKLSTKFSDLCFNYMYSDENIGYNCDIVDFYDGVGIEKNIQEDSIEAYELAFELRPEIKDTYELVEGKYKYKEGN